MSGLRERLLAVEVPDAEAARARSAVVVGGAFAERGGAPSRRRRLAPPAAVAGVLVAGAAAWAASAPSVVSRWFGAVVDPGPARHLARLPADGRLLLLEDGHAALVAPDGTRAGLGRFADATWSPHGMFVAGARGRELVAVDPAGAARWTVTAPGRVRDPRWAPDGYRIAYRSGGGLRVVAGDGTGDRLLSARVAPVAPAWRPGASHVLAYAGPGAVVVAETDTPRRHRTTLPRHPHWLGWAGERLLAATRRGVASARARWRAPRGTRVVAAAVAPDARRLAVALRRGTLTRVVLLGTDRLRPLRAPFTLTGRLADLTWSPDGRWLAASARGRWLLLPLAPGARPRALHGTARPRAWCCAP